MNSTIFQIMATLALSSFAAIAEVKPLSTYSAEECHDLIERGGELLIKDHGDELLGLLYFRRKPTDAELSELTSRPQIVKETKHDLPVFQALRNGGGGTLQLLRHSNYFDYPQHPTDMEVIAYLLHEMMGSDDAAKFAEDRVREGTAYARDNWLTISGMLEHPELASSRFIVEKTVKGSTAEPMPTIEQLRKQRMQLKSLVTMIPSESRDSLLSIHLQFRKVLEACMLFRVAKKEWPTSLFRLVQESSIKESEIMFIDSNGFQYFPRLSKNVGQDDKGQCVLKLISPDGKFAFQGFLNGDIDVTQAERK